MLAMNSVTIFRRTCLRPTAACFLFALRSRNIVTRTAMPQNSIDPWNDQYCASFNVHAGFLYQGSTDSGHCSVVCRSMRIPQSQLLPIDLQHFVEWVIRRKAAVVDQYCQFSPLPHSLSSEACRNSHCRRVGWSLGRNSGRSKGVSTPH